MEYITGNQLIHNSSDSVDWLVPDRLMAGGLNLLAGEVASGKTFLALDLALGVSTRAQAWGGMTVPTGPVLYYCLDSNQKTVGYRLKYLCEGYGIQPSDNLHFDFNLHDFSEPLESEKLKQRIKEHGYSLVIIDVLARYLPGLDENMVSSVGPVLTRLRQITDETDATLLLIHHFNKGGLRNQAISQGLRIRGSSDIFAAVDTALTLVTKGSARVLLPIKNRMGQEAPPLSFQLVKGENDAISLDFLSNEESEESTYGTMVPLILHTIMKILIVKAGSFFKRDVLEDLLVDFGSVPSQRTLDTVFAQLPSQLGVRVERQGLHKFYGYIRQEESSQEPDPNAEAELEQEEVGGSKALPLDWESDDDEEEEAMRVERVKQMMKKVLYPKLDEMRQKMRDQLDASGEISKG